MRILWCFVLLASILPLVHPKTDNDFYELLGIERSTDLRGIRKAFKKLALTLHPDKNVGDEEAHERFVAINRAYEVLKDDDLRKIYDEYGESGLKQHETGRGRDNYARYQSWTYYNEYFGIYDNDDDIITLSRSDFEQSVNGQRLEGLWFINFYSPRCSHCHTLAPEWRKLAKALRNIIRVGAVNCVEDRDLCQAESIRSYPSLILYPQRKRFEHDSARESKQLIKFVLANLNVKVKRYNDVNMKYLLKELSPQSENKKTFSGRPTSWYLIAACHDRKRCLSETKLALLTYKLTGIVQVVEIVCDSESKQICDHFRLHENKLSLHEDLQNNPNTYFEIDNLKTQSDEDDDIESIAQQLDAIFNKVILHFPAVQRISQNDKQFLDDCLFGKEQVQCKERLGKGWILTMFRDDAQKEKHDSEMRLLSHLMSSRTIMYVACEEDEASRIFCSKFESNNVKQYPRLNTLKYVKTASYEKYYGRFNAIDILNFALDSFESQLRVLNPTEFENSIVNDRENAHVVQFFSPRCPACKVAQQKLRKLSQYPFPRPVTFGVIDCGVYSQLCRRYNIRSYPTVLLYNDTVPHEYVGKFNQDKPLLDFIQYTLKSNLIQMDAELFQKEIQPILRKRSSSNPMWVVSFSSPYCYICQVLSPTLRKLSSILIQELDSTTIKIATVDCNQHRDLCSEQQIQSYPTIRLFPSSNDRKHTSSFYTFKNRRDFHMLRSWVYDFLPDSSVTEIESTSEFEELISNASPTVIEFYSPWAFSSRRFQPEFIRLSQRIPEIQFKRLNCENMAQLCDDLKVHFYPSLRFYSGDQSSSNEHYRRGIHIQIPDLEDVDEFDLADLTNSIESLSSQVVDKTSNSIKTEL